MNRKLKTCPISRLLLLTSCVWLWTNVAHAQRLTRETFDADFGRIVIEALGDSAALDSQLASAVAELSAQRGILLDAKQLNREELHSAALNAALWRAFASFTKPTVLLVTQKVERESALAAWAKERYWTRIETSGETKKAERKLKSLNGRRMKEGQERMDWLMQQGRPK